MHIELDLGFDNNWYQFYCQNPFYVLCKCLLNRGDTIAQYIAQFIGTDPLAEPMTAVSHTANYAIGKLLHKIEKKLNEGTSAQIADIVENGAVPEMLVYSAFERDACAVLYGSDDLRPHIRVHRLPPHA